MNIAFYISGKSERLHKYLNQASEYVAQLIKVVVSDHEIENSLKLLLDQLEIDTFIYEYSELPDGMDRAEKNEKLSKNILSVLDKYSVDYCFSFGSHLLRGELLNRYRYRLINFHPSILPMYPGRKSIDQAVEHGNTFLVGNTAHFIDEGMDTGLIIMQTVIPLQSYYDSENDYNVVLDLQIEMLNKLILILDRELLSVIDEKVKIAGANYKISHIYPDMVSLSD